MTCASLRNVDDLATLFNAHWKDSAAVQATVRHKIPKLLESDQAYQNARKYSDTANIRIEGELAIQRAISAILSDYIELFQQFTQNRDFKERLTSFVLALLDRGHGN